jgi:hypothetical protein
MCLDPERQCARRFQLDLQNCVCENVFALFFKFILCICSVRDFGTARLAFLAKSTVVEFTDAHLTRNVGTLLWLDLLLF